MYFLHKIHVNIINNVQERDSSQTMNVYHKALLSWNFQKALHGYKGDQDGMPKLQTKCWQIE